MLNTHPGPVVAGWLFHVTFDGVHDDARAVAVIEPADGKVTRATPDSTADSTVRPAGMTIGILISVRRSGFFASTRREPS